MLKRFFNLFKTKLVKFFAVAMIAFTFTFSLTSCDLVNGDNNYITGNYVLHESGEGTLVTFDMTLENDAIYDVTSVSISFNLFRNNKHVGNSQPIETKVNVNHNDSATFNNNFYVNEKINQLEIDYWNCEYASFWDTYNIWIIVLIVIAALAAIGYNIYIYYEDNDFSDVLDDISLSDFNWVIYATLPVIVSIFACIIPVANVGWIPVCLVLGSIVAFGVLVLLSHGIKMIYNHFTDIPLPDYEELSGYSDKELKECADVFDVEYDKDTNREDLIQAILASFEYDEDDDDYDDDEDEEDEEDDEEERDEIQYKSKAHKNGVRFDSIAGLNEAKEAFKEKVILPFEHPEIFEKFNKKAGGGILLYGLPGTGKTMFAEASSNEVDALFIPIKCSDIKSKWYGESEANVKKIFAKARKAKRAIIFFDEFEAIGSKRSDDNDNGNNDLVPQILAEMQGVGSKSNNSTIVVIAATNKPWAIDSAFLRPGRFDEKIYIPLPDYEARLKLLKINLKGVPCSEDLDLTSLAKDTEGFNGADIKEICEKLKMNAIKKSLETNKEHCISNTDIDEIKSSIKSSVSMEDIIRLKEFENNN